MKFFLALITLAVLVAVNNSASLQKYNRANLIIGWRPPGEVLLRRASVSLPPVANLIQYQDYVYQGDRRTYITSINAYEMGWNYAVAYIVNGGIRQKDVTLRLQTARGHGLNYTIEIYGLHY